MAAGDLITTGYQLELGGVLMGLDTTLVIEGPVEGFGRPAARATGGNRPAQHGQYPVRQYLPGKSIVWTVAVLGESTDDTLQQLIAAQSAFTPRLEGDTVELVVRIGSIAYLLIGQPGATSTDLELIGDFPSTARLHCEFVATDPRAYNLEEQTDETDLGSSDGGLAFPHGFPHGFGAASPGLLTAVNYGTIETYPTFRITAGVGGLENPGLIAISPYDATFRVLISLSEGDFLDIDMGARTVVLNGTASRTAFVNRPDEDDWMAIPGGPGGGLIGGELDVQFVGTGAGHAVMSWHSANLL